MITMSFFLCLFMHLYLVRENTRRDADMERLGLTLESYSEDQRYQEREKGDNASVSTDIYASQHFTQLCLVLPLHRLKPS